MLPETQRVAANNSFHITILYAEVRERINLRGIFSICFAPGLIINDCKLFRKNGKWVVRLPDHESQKKDGTKKPPIIMLATRALYEEFQRTVLAVLAALAEQPEGELLFQNIEAEDLPCQDTEPAF